MVKLYQNIEAEGAEFQHENSKRKDSKFWNEGKWDTFIDPLLTEDYEDCTFIEMGCNAGLFLKMAKDKGFRDVIGIDKSRSAIKEGIRYRDLLEYDYKMKLCRVGGDFNIEDMPMADVTLLSTVHYYFDIGDWIKYLDRLQYKTRYCLVVSRHLTGYTEDVHYIPSGEFNDIRNYFKDWEQIGAIYNPSTTGDPNPRKDIWSLLFKNNKLKREPIKDFVGGGRSKMKRQMYELAQDIVDRKNIIPQETSYYKTWVKRKEGRWTEGRILKFVEDKIEMMIDVRDNGIKDPILMKMYGQNADGGHRLIMADLLGYKSVITRII